MGRLKGGDGFLVGHGVIAGKGPQTQRCLRRFNRMKKQIETGERGDQNQQSRSFTKGQFNREKAVFHAHS